MVLVLPSTPNPHPDLLQAVLSDTELQQSTQRFLASAGLPLPVEPDICRLYVNQGEQAFACWGTPPWTDLVVGSQSATTCLVMVVRCTHSKRVYVVHHDRGSAGLQAHVVMAFLQGMTKPEVYLVGSFHENTGESLFVASTILSHLHNSTTQQVHVRLACLWTANTDPSNGRFRAHSLYVHCSTGDAYGALLEDEEIPGLPRRLAFASCCGVAQVDRRLVTVSLYDTPGYVLLPPIPVPRHAGFIRYLMHQLTQPDDRILRECSTSPDHEPDYFPRHMRGSWMWTIAMFQEAMKRDAEDGGREQDGVPVACFRWLDDNAAGEDGNGVWVVCDVPEGLDLQRLTDLGKAVHLVLAFADVS